jgi:streptomycin 6-kinase
MNSLIVEPAPDRTTKQIQAWNIVADESRETQDSFLTFGTRDGQAVVLKVIKRPGDEWHSGEVLEAFEGKGVVRTLGFVEGAVLMERLQPGTSVADVSLQGRDEEATEIIARVIRAMSPCQFAAVPTVKDFSRSFGQYLAHGDRQIPTELVEDAQRTYSELCESQTGVRLLHGDLHHYNVLMDDQRGWLAIDPKGVVGELEYELGASLRNPLAKPELFTLGKTVEARMRVFDKTLRLDSSRVLRWAFSQAVLATIWFVEDGFPVEDGHPFLVLAHVTRSILGMS